MKETLKAIFPTDIPASAAKHGARLFLWILAFGILQIVPTIARSVGWDFSTPVLISLSIILLATGIAMIVSFRNYLDNADELERTIQTGALALSTGAGIVGSAVYMMLERTDLVSAVDITHIVVLISLTYSIGLIAGRIRYR